MKNGKGAIREINSTKDTSNPGNKLPAILNRFLGRGNAVNDDNLFSLSEVERNLMNDLHFSSSERKEMCSRWFQMADKVTRKLSYKSFMQCFGFRDETWIRRLFDIINHTLNGSVTLAEFLQFTLKYLIVDKSSTLELSFRLLSRRGSTYVAKWSVLDLEDIINFISFRYVEIKKLSSKQRKALDVLVAIDTNEDGGVDIREFEAFCQKNPIFVRISHSVQNYMRRRIFGLDFWVNTSRKIKFWSAGFGTMTILSRANMESESYTLVHLRDPVISTHIKKIQKQEAEHLGSAAAADEAFRSEENAAALQERRLERSRSAERNFPAVSFSFADW